MEMRTILPLLVIGVTICFDAATSKYIIRNGDGDTKQDSAAMPSCLQKAMVENGTAVDGVIIFLCSFMKYKDMRNKEELMEAIQHLVDITGCSAKDIFGSEASLEQVALDRNGVLTSHITIMEQLLENHVILPITTTVCAFLNYIEKSSDFVLQSSNGVIQRKNRNTRDLLGLLGGLTGGLDGIGALLNLLCIVGKAVKVVDPVLSLVGKLLDGLGGVTNLLGGGLNGVTGLLGPLLGGLGGSSASQGDLLGGLLGGLTDTLGGLTGGILNG
ncbi:uncharacterized protein LOC143773770 [Ranitomeya variabilis]|uniref:uncharacterized protein LOC143773770 n=1 Tax=Ranitomeya variabilis TaxID=490064 RepID=UPI004056E625